MPGQIVACGSETSRLLNLPQGIILTVVLVVMIVLYVLIKAKAPQEAPAEPKKT